VINSKALSTARSGAPPLLATVAIAGLLAGCGSSGSEGTIGVNNQNTGDNALVTATEKSATTPATASAEAKTPTTGALSKKPTVTPPTGPPPKTLVIHEIIKGTGKEVTSPKATVTVNYVGVLYNGGTEFDSSWKRNEPATFSLTSVIPGWTRGIPGMRVGGRRELIIPARLAYGAAGSGSSIPPNAPLVFVIDLLGTTG
jgi:peptidylprolyl isomerase